MVSKKIGDSVGFAAERVYFHPVSKRGSLLKHSRMSYLCLGHRWQEIAGFITECGYGKGFY